ncbi:uncharacterized protein LOC126790626 [Argentina anserina]|uniref:uncharacterized protein LOC126790626 n=1 Tax=Argentina anserina TaxID=57926 RepID=UPI0021762081|nr:uncharacterized protein LOC126790626 [Potentilla anserina]
MAKYIYAEIERTGVGPSPIEMFQRFHVTAGKDGEEERWSSKKAKELYDEMELKKRIEEVLGGEGEEELDEWDIYKEVVSGSKKRHIRGLGDGMEPPEEFYNSSGSRPCLEREEEFRAMKEEVGSLRADVAENKKLLQALMDMVTLGLGAYSSSPPNDTIISPTHGDSEEDCAP